MSFFFEMGFGTAQGCVKKIIDRKLIRALLSASGYGPPSADLAPPPTKLSENIILNVLVKMDDTLRSSTY